MSLRKVLSALIEKESFVITGHVNPEGDAIGSGLALALALREMDKKAVVVNWDPLPKQLSFLPHEGLLFQKEALLDPIDTLVVVDCGDLRRTGFFNGKPPSIQTLINIDHHLTNPGFGDINWIAPEATATASMIYELLKEIGSRITPEIATSLYAALLGETGSFRYSNTDAKALVMAAELVEAGADPAKIARALFETHSVGKVRLLGEALTRLQLSADRKIAWITVSQAQLQAYQTTEEDTEEFVNYPRSIEGVEAAVFIREIGFERYKISFRSQGKIDVSLLAKSFGGGGHRNASGCERAGTLEKVREEILSAVQEAVNALEGVRL